MLPPTPTQYILFQLDFNIKFPLLRLLQLTKSLASVNPLYLPLVAAFETLFVIITVDKYASNFEYFINQNLTSAKIILIHSKQNIFCTQESFNTNILHQLFVFITFFVSS